MDRRPGRGAPPIRIPARRVAGGLDAVRPPGREHRAIRDRGYRDRLPGARGIRVPREALFRVYTERSGRYDLDLRAVFGRIAMTATAAPDPAPARVRARRRSARRRLDPHRLHAQGVCARLPRPARGRLHRRARRRDLRRRSTPGGSASSTRPALAGARDRRAAWSRIGRSRATASSARSSPQPHPAGLPRLRRPRRDPGARDEGRARRARGPGPSSGARAAARRSGCSAASSIGARSPRQRGGPDVIEGCPDP